jgi:hypothetical protein
LAKPVSVRYSPSIGRDRAPWLNGRRMFKLIGRDLAVLARIDAALTELGMTHKI